MKKMYKKFKVGDLFEIKGVKQAKSQSAIPDDNNGIPYVVQSQSNNMVSRYVNEQYLIDNDEPICNGNVIVLGVTLPAVSYQAYKFGASQVITARADFLNEKVGLYFVALFEQQMAQFSYQNKPGIQIYKDMELLLPLVDGSVDKIDFNYMESYISMLEQERMSELDTYLKNAGLNNDKLSKSDQDILAKTGQKFSNFRIGDLFDIHPTKAYKHSNRELFSERGIYDVVTNTSSNCGRSGKSELEYTEKDIITFSDTGTKSPETFFFQEGPFIGYSHVQGMYPTEKKWNKYSSMFLITLLRAKTVGIYDYTTKMTRSDIQNMVVSLPIDTNGNIDFEFMENYIKSIEKETVINVVKYKNSVLRPETSNKCIQ